MSRFVFVVGVITIAYGAIWTLGLFLLWYEVLSHSHPPAIVDTWAYVGALLAIPLPFFLIGLTLILHARSHVPKVDSPKNSERVPRT